MKVSNLRYCFNIVFSLKAIILIAIISAECKSTDNPKDVNVNRFVTKTPPRVDHAYPRRVSSKSMPPRGHDPPIPFPGFPPLYPVSASHVVYIWHPPEVNDQQIEDGAAALLTKKNGGVAMTQAKNLVKKKDPRQHKPSDRPFFDDFIKGGNKMADHRAFGFEISVNPFERQDDAIFPQGFEPDWMDLFPPFLSPHAGQNTGRHPHHHRHHNAHDPQHREQTHPGTHDQGLEMKSKDSEDILSLPWNFNDEQVMRDLSAFMDMPNDVFGLEQAKSMPGLENTPRGWLSDVMERARKQDERENTVEGHGDIGFEGQANRAKDSLLVSPMFNGRADMKTQGKASYESIPDKDGSHKNNAKTTEEDGHGPAMSSDNTLPSRIQDNDKKGSDDKGRHFLDDNHHSINPFLKTNMANHKTSSKVDGEKNTAEHEIRAISLDDANSESNNSGKQKVQYTEDKDVEDFKKRMISLRNRAHKKSPMKRRAATQKSNNSTKSVGPKSKQSDSNTAGSVSNSHPDVVGNSKNTPPKNVDKDKKGHDGVKGAGTVHETKKKNPFHYDVGKDDGTTEKPVEEKEKTTMTPTEKANDEENEDEENKFLAMKTLSWDKHSSGSTLHHHGMGLVILGLLLSVIIIVACAITCAASKGSNQGLQRVNSRTAIYSPHDFY